MPHEKEWSGRCVDKGIHDEWLAIINGLKYFRPYSSCEGHSFRTGAGCSDHARIYFGLEDSDFISRLKPLWIKHESDFQALVAKHFPKEMTKIVFRMDKTICGQEGLCLHLESTVIRQTENMPDTVIKWFESTTHALPVFETALIEMVKSLCQ